MSDKPMVARQSGEVLIEVENLSKKFSRDLKRSLIYGVQDVMRELGGRPVTADLRPYEFWALRDVSFTVRRGEALGVIGPNGAGKTTLLRLLNGLIKPTSGRIQMRGRVQALIALNAGVSPILTGRENIYINAATFGIPRSEVDKVIDDIIEFAEIGDFIDTPMRNYSSGMQVRLGFSVAIHVKPDVLIIDEVLAVGDAKFRRKARNAMSQMLERDVALIFISHNMHEVLGITDKSLWLNHGQTVMLDESEVVCSRYLMGALEDDVSGDTPFAYGQKRSEDLVVRQVATEVAGEAFERHITLDVDRQVRIKIDLEAQSPINEVVFHQFQLETVTNEAVGQIVIHDDIRADVGQHLHYEFDMDLSDILPGRYVVKYMLPTDGGPELDHIMNLLYIDVVQSQALRTFTPVVGETNRQRMGSNRRGALSLSVRMVRPVPQTP